MIDAGKDTRQLGRDGQRLLLLAARESWDAGQAARACKLAATVRDWDGFCDVAIRSFGAGLAYCSLSSLDAGCVPQRVLDRMRSASRMFAVRSLQMDATLLAFVSGCIAPLGIRHAFFKGMPLAHRYYHAPAARPCRDIDVLVDPQGALDIVRRASALGYVPIEDIGPGERALAAWVKRATVYPMRATNGVLIEIHKSLDHGDDMLDVDRMLSRAEAMEFRGQPLSVLRTSDLFVYICMHHTRHFWSHLHWYADLDAMIRHSQFDLAEVREVAARARLAPTVEACLRLHDFARSGDWPALISIDQGPGEALLVRSLECLEGGREREDALRASRLSRDRAFTWQVTAMERMALFVRKHGRRLVFGPVRRLRAWFKASPWGTKSRAPAEGQN